MLDTHDSRPVPTLVRRCTYLAVALTLLGWLAFGADSADAQESELRIVPLGQIAAPAPGRPMIDENPTDTTLSEPGAEADLGAAVTTEAVVQPGIAIIPRFGTLPEPPSDIDIQAARYQAAKAAIPFDRTLHLSNPTYRHEAALALTFGHAPKTLYRQGFKVGEQAGTNVDPKQYWYLQDRDFLYRSYVPFPYLNGSGFGFPFLGFGGGAGLLPPVPPVGPVVPPLSPFAPGVGGIGTVGFGAQLFPRGYQPWR